MPNLHVVLVNEDTNTRFSEFDEEWDDDNLFLALSREYGRCRSKVYIDQADAPPKAIGWYFEKRDHYDGRSRTGQDTYLRGAWVTIIEPRHQCPTCNGRGYIEEDEDE